MKTNPLYSLYRPFCAAVALLAIGSGNVKAQDALQSLEVFLRTAQSGTANFTQVVTQPASKAAGAAPQNATKAQTSTGTFAFARPNRFKLVYTTPFAQSIVADGQHLWVHDVDLEQVTKRQQAALLTQTPLAVIVQAKSMAALQQLFDIKPSVCDDKLQCVQLTPRAKDGQTQSVTLRFHGSATPPAKVVLHSLHVVDASGQNTQMVFSNMQHNPKLAADAFKFTPPKGVDVIVQ